MRVVRSISDFTIQGDAWTWWDHAAGRYERDTAPVAGSVLVFRRAGRLHRGHVSLVSAVLDNRTIEVDHSWEGGYGLRRGMRVIDISPRNDWSQVRVWSAAVAQYGQTSFPTYGFVLPEGGETRRGFTPEPAVAVVPAGRAPRAIRGPMARTVVASAHQRHLSPSVRGHQTTVVASRAVHGPVAAPGHKPTGTMVASVSVSVPATRQGPVPARKPGASQVASSTP